MEEHRARARRNTRQALPRRPHPIGSPERGLSTNTGALAASAWLADRGLTPTDARWFVEVAIAPHGRATRFQLDVYAEEWGFQFEHEGRKSWIRVTDVPFVHGRDDHGLLARTPRLRDVALLIAELEREHAVRFDRDTPLIRSNVANAESVLQNWIANL